MPRYAARVDDNQKRIVQDLRSVGCSVTPLHMVGKGFPDIVVGYRGVNYLIEIKDGNKSPSQRRLTPDEFRWHARWNGQVAIAKNSDEALRIVGAL